MAFQAAQTLGSSLRRVFERGWSEQVRVMPDGQSRLREVLWDGPVLSLRLTELRGVSAEPILQDFELQRRGLKSWQPWLSLEGEDLQGWSSMADFLTCAPL